MLFSLDYCGHPNKYGLLQYTFDGPEVEVKAKPHGNSKRSMPYFRTGASTKKHIRELAVESTPKTVVHTITKQQGGEILAKGAAYLPRDRQQVANFRRSVAKPKDTNVLYSIMVECKLAQGKKDAFIRDVKAAPEPQSVLFYDWQLDDLVRLCTNNKQLSVMSVDTTFNLGEFYVTPITYRHSLLEGIRSGKHPIMIGPVLVHQRLQFATFNYFLSTLVGSNKLLRNLLAVGTDGDENVTDACGHNFPFAVQLRCFIHFKRNLQEKLRDLGIPKAVANKFLDDVFGKCEGNVRFEGLVDSTSIDDFDKKFEALQECWNGRERPYSGDAGPQFHNHFSRYFAKVVRNHMRKDQRELVGLGSPPTIYTTNASEALNSVLKKGVNFKKTQWPEFVQSVKHLVDAQYEEIVRALSGRGQYRLCEETRHLGVVLEEWNKMRPDQRQRIVQWFMSYRPTVTTSTFTSEAESVVSVKDGQQSGPKSTDKPGCSKVNSLLISAEESGIHTIPLITLEAIWSKAAALLQGDNTISPAPGRDRRSHVVISYRSDTPHLVQPKANGQYTCDDKCPQWVSAKICSHTVAVAALNASLEGFLQWYKSSATTPNVTRLAMIGMPANRGRKKGQSSNSWKGRTTTKVAPDAIISSPPGLVHNIMPASCSHTSDSGLNPANSVPIVPSSSSYSGTTPLGQQPPRLSGYSTQQQLQLGPPPLIVVGQSNSASFSPVPCTSETPRHHTSSVSPPNTNPFYLRFISGNIRTCQGCHSTLRPGGAIPNPPYNLTVARAERRPYRNTSGTVVTPYKESISHYHCCVECVQSGDPKFVPMSLLIPLDLYSQLNSVHREYLHSAFGLNL